MCMDTGSNLKLIRIKIHHLHEQLLPVVIRGKGLLFEAPFWSVRVLQAVAWLPSLKLVIDLPKQRGLLKVKD